MIIAPFRWPSRVQHSPAQPSTCHLGRGMGLIDGAGVGLARPRAETGTHELRRPRAVPCRRAARTHGGISTATREDSRLHIVTRACTCSTANVLALTVGPGLPGLPGTAPAPNKPISTTRMLCRFSLPQKYTWAGRGRWAHVKVSGQASHDCPVASLDGIKAPCPWPRPHAAARPEAINSIPGQVGLGRLKGRGIGIPAGRCQPCGWHTA